MLFRSVRTARKHIGWYVRDLPGGALFCARMNTLEATAAQCAAVADFLDGLGAHDAPLPYTNSIPESLAA